jgi:hypothetical protein
MNKHNGLEICFANVLILRNPNPNSSFLKEIYKINPDFQASAI